MSICEQLQQQLDRLPDGAELPAPQLIQVDGDGFHLTCEIAGVGTLGCAVNYLTVKSERLAGSTTEQLKSQAEHLASKLTYLLEPVVPIEIDSEGCAVQLRSNPPHCENDERSYYELLLHRGGELSLRRYRQKHNECREPVSAQLTREVLGRLAGDLVETP